MFIRMFGHVMFAKLIVLRGGSEVFVFYPGQRDCNIGSEAGDPKLSSRNPIKRFPVPSSHPNQGYDS